MFKKTVASLITILLLISCGDMGRNENVGTIFGALGGAAIGSQFGKGEGMIVGAVLGTFAGSMIGGSIGRQMDERDKQYHARTSAAALETAPDGQAMAWVNPNNGHSGSITPVRTYQKMQSNKSVYCREYQQAVEINGQKQNAYGTACRQPDGSWQIVK